MASTGRRNGGSYMPEPDRPFRSILFDQPGGAAQAEQSQQPSCFPDLNLDQALDWMTTGRGEYQLKPFFYTPLPDPGAVEYRHDILRDLENEPTRQTVQEFAAQMRRMRKQLEQAGKLHYRYQQESWFADAVDTYCQAARALTEGLSRLGLSSRGFQGLTRYLTRYITSDAFTSLVAQTQQLYRDLATVSYSIHIKGSRVRVTKYEDEPDYSAEVVKTFAKFKQGAVKSYRSASSLTGRKWTMSKPASWTRGPSCTRTCSPSLGRIRRHPHRVPRPTVTVLRPRSAVLPRLPGVYRAAQEGRAQFCYPQVSAGAKEIIRRGTFDAGSASKLVSEHPPWYQRLLLRGPSGSWSSPARTRAARPRSPARSGNCTTWPASGSWSRPPGRAAPVRRGFHPLRARGKHARPCTASLKTSSPGSTRSLAGHGQQRVIMNEIFTSTTLKDALFLGTRGDASSSSTWICCAYM